MNDKWLLSEYMILLQTQNGGKVIVDTRPALKLQFAYCEPLIREDEAKKFEGWKSPEEINEMEERAYKLMIDERTKTLKEVLSYIECPVCYSSQMELKENKLQCSACGKILTLSSKE